jgi:3-oxoadipate enol-lactonase
VQPGFVERDGVRLHYVVSGRNHAPALLLLHPLGASLEVWSRQMPEFERFFRVVRYDARGHGKSVLPEGAPEPRSIDDLADDALAVLDALRIERAHWCGQSLGGMVAMSAARRVPRRVTRLVLANTSPFLPPASMWDERIETVRQSGMDPIAEAVPPRWFTPGFIERAPEAVERVVAMVRATQPRGYAEACGAIRDMDQREAIAAITAPTLVITGAQDPATPLEHSEELVARIPGADLVVLDASHLANVEQPEDFTAAVVDFLRD